MKSPLRWPGGKGRLAGDILAYVREHRAYVETCCGGAAVFWAKPRGWSKAEILNDADGELINFYQVLHKRGRRLMREVDSMPYSRALFDRVRDGRPRSAFARAVRFWYLNRLAFGATPTRPSFGPRASGHSNVLPEGVLTKLDATLERLRGVLFESVDVVRLIQLYDRPTTQLYVDPPYYHLWNSYRCQFREEDHARLAQALRCVKGTYLLSYNDHAEVRRLYKGCRWTHLTTRYTIRGNSPEYRSRGPRTELLISNRPLRRRKVTPT